MTAARRLSAILNVSQSSKALPIALARYFELDSDLGHSSSGPEHAKWSPVLRGFLAPLVARLN